MGMAHSYRGAGVYLGNFFDWFGSSFSFTFVLFFQNSPGGA